MARPCSPSRCASAARSSGKVSSISTRSPPASTSAASSSRPSPSGSTSTPTARSPRLPSGLDRRRRGRRRQDDHDAVRAQHVERAHGHVPADEVVDDIDRLDDLLEACWPGSVDRLVDAEVGGRSCSPPRPSRSACAPRDFAIWHGEMPTTPAPACTSTRWPGLHRAATSTRHCQRGQPGEGQAAGLDGAAARRDGGRSAATGAVTNSAYADAGRGNQGIPKTGSPTAKRVTPGPTASSTTPRRPSRRSAAAPLRRGTLPARVFQSTGFTPGGLRPGRAPPWPIGSGAAGRWSSRTSGAPEGILDDRAPWSPRRSSYQRTGAPR